MNRSHWVRITLRAHENDSWAEINLPLFEVLSGLVNLVEPGSASITVGDFYGNGDGVKVTIERVTK